MKTIIQLSHFQVKQLIRERSFLYAVSVVVVFALFMIPGKDSNYMTFYIGGHTGFPDAFWVSSLGSVLINLVISFVGFFFLEGMYKTEKESGMGQILRVSPISNFRIIFSKWITCILILGILAKAGMVSLYIVNFEAFNPITFIQPFLYFTLPYVVFISSLIVLFDYGISSRVVKIMGFLFLVTFICVPNFSMMTDFMGFSEFRQAINNQFETQIGISDNDFGIGYIPKAESFEYFHFEAFAWKEKWFYKLSMIIGSSLMVYLFSFCFSRYKLKRKSGSSLPSKKSVYDLKHFRAISKQVFSFKPTIKAKWTNVLQANWIVFKSSFTKMNIISYCALWVSCFFTSHKLCTSILIPLLFLIGFKLLERMVDLINKPSTWIYFSTSMHNRGQYAIASCLFLFLFFMISSIPVFMHLELQQITVSIIKILIFALVLVSGIWASKKVKIWEIAYMFVFGSYLAGSPILNLF